MRAKEGEGALLGAEKDNEIKNLEDKRAQERKSSQQPERSAQSELARARAELAWRDQEMLSLQKDLQDSVARARITAAELAAAQQLNQRAEQSVTWQALQRGSAALYGRIGEDSPAARLLQRFLLGAGRLLVKWPEGDLARSGEDVNALKLPQYRDPQVSLIIPVHAHAELTFACLSAIRRNTSPVTYEVIVVDDAADAETKRLLRKVSGARVVENQKNIGYLCSIERGANIARGEWLVLCNNDTEVQPGWLRAMLDCAASDQDIGVVTPKYIYPDGRLNEAGGVIWRDGTGTKFGRGDAPDRPAYEHRRETDYGSGAALMVNAKLWRQIGGFDQRFRPMYYEDADFCFAARELGEKVVYEPKAVVVHLEGGTAGNDPASGAKRHQEANRPKFVEKWRHRLTDEHPYPATGDIRALADRRRGPHVLLVDCRIPTWDRDAGSLRMLGMIRALLALGARVTLLPDQPAPLEPYTGVLRSMGVEVLCSPFDPHLELSAVCSDLDAAIVCRPTIASRWLDTIRDFAPLARVAYDTVDLHWIREARRLALDGSFITSFDHRNGDLDSSTLPPKVRALRELELAMVRATDVTVVVSDIERMQIEYDAPGTEVMVLPTVHDVAHDVPAATERSGVLFIGGFAHTPNVDAVIKLVQDIMPGIWKELGDVRLVVVGDYVPPQVSSLASARVEIAGWVRNLQPLLEQSRLMLAPMTYGAGIKGKITQCLAAGLPVVTTTIGAEGIDPACLLVENDPLEFAAAATRLYRDDALWTRLSRAGQEFVASQCSQTRMMAGLAALLDPQPSFQA